MRAHRLMAVVAVLLVATVAHATSCTVAGVTVTVRGLVAHDTPKMLMTTPGGLKAQFRGGMKMASAMHDSGYDWVCLHLSGDGVLPIAEPAQFVVTRADGSTVTSVRVLMTDALEELHVYEPPLAVRPGDGRYAQSLDGFTVVMVGFLPGTFNARHGCDWWADTDDICKLEVTR